MEQVLTHIPVLNETKHGPGKSWVPRPTNVEVIVRWVFAWNTQTLNLFECKS